VSDETADAVVIGAGLNGAATAYFLLREGIKRVLVLDSGMPNSGASGAAVGLLRSHYDNRPECELAAKSMPFFRNWAEMVGGSCGWRQTGFFRFVEPTELANMERNVAFQREFGEEVETLSPRDLREIAPQFIEDGVGAVVYEPKSGTASNSRATTSMLAAASGIGAAIRPFNAATALLVEGGRIVGVDTAAGRVATPVVVLAAGSWSRMLAATCGVDIPLVAKAICAAEILLPKGFHVPGSFMDPISDSWITPRDQGRAIISAPHGAAGKTIDPDNYPREFPRDDAEAGLAPVRKRLKGLEPALISRWWTRPDSYSPDGKPILGSVEEVAGLFLNTAGAGKGHKTAPAIGAALAELVASGRSRIADLTPFNIARFKEPPRSWSDSEYTKRVIG
jgi:sarcosine oxidase, subunit beta